MSKTISKLVFGISTLIFTAYSNHNASADAPKSGLGPQATVQEIVNRMKTEGNPSVVVEYVNWNKAFSDFPENKRDQLNIHNAEELKAFFFDMLAHPTQTLKAQMEKRLTLVPAEKQEAVKQEIAKVEAAMKLKEQEMRDLLTGTEYKVGEAKLNGSKATVQLTQNYKTNKRVEDVLLEKEGDRWLLPSANLGADPNASEPAAQATEKQ